jgi:hypothetical protein
VGKLGRAYNRISMIMWRKERDVRWEEEKGEGKREGE